MKIRSLFSRLALLTSVAFGTWQAFFIAFSLIVMWVIGGVFIGFDNTNYQLIINTVTTIITFLMVFLIQASQNRDTYALHAKLDELIRAIPKARDDLRAVELLPEDELRDLRKKPAPTVKPRPKRLAK